MKLPSAFVKSSNNINVIIETPKGCGNKYTFDKKRELFKLSKVLPDGMVFPAHFGFIPRTKGEDGDPLDVLVLMDEMSYPGNLIECKVMGIIEAEQTEKTGETFRNDRIIAAATLAQRYLQTTSLKSLDKYLIDEITKFFITYNAMSNKKFVPLAYRGPSAATRLIKKQMI
jgi:inorganic pyrophosphatase